jgi:hypothetical protein
MDHAPPSRADLRAHPPTLLHAGRNWTKADVFLWERGGAPLAIKDYAARPVWVRATLGRFFVARELAAYARLRGVPGVPACAGRVDPHALAVEYLAGSPLAAHRRGEVSSVVFDRLAALVASVHRAGVAHGDLHHRDVIVDQADRPALVDFSTAIVSRRGGSGEGGTLFRWACASDRRAVLKLKRRYVPEALRPEEARELERVPGAVRIGKWIRRRILRRGLR